MTGNQKETDGQRLEQRRFQLMVILMFMVGMNFI